MGRISRTITLAKVSWRGLRQDRELLVLPVLSFLVSGGVLLAIWLPTMAVADLPGVASEEGGVDAVVALAGLASALLLSVVGVVFLVPLALVVRLPALLVPAEFEAALGDVSEIRTDNGPT